MLVCIPAQTQFFAQSKVLTGWMIPKIDIDDRLIINKIETKYKELNRGDIIVFLKEKSITRRIVD